MQEPLEVAQSNVDMEVKAVEVKAGAAPDPKEMLERINTIGHALRDLIVEAKRLPRDKTLGPYQDEMRCLAQAQTHLQNGLMWLRRAVEAPKIF